MAPSDVTVVQMSCPGAVLVVHYGQCYMMALFVTMRRSSYSVVLVVGGSRLVLYGTAQVAAH